MTKEINVISRIKKLNVALNEEMNELSTLMSRLQKNHPATSALFQSNLYFIYCIDDSLRLLLEQNKLFSSKIIYRSLIEAFVEWLYVLNKFDEEKEKFSEEYHLTRLATERLLKEKAYFKVNSNNTKSSVDVRKKIIEKPSKNKKFISVETYKQRNKTFRDKVDYLYEKDTISNIENGSIGTIVRKYNNLSSFVHINYEGFQNFVFSNDDNLEILRIYSISFTIKLLAYKSFCEFCQKILNEEIIIIEKFRAINKELLEKTDFLFQE